MTIEGAIVDLQKWIDSEEIPFWAKPSLQKILETVEAEREEHLWIPVTERLPEEDGWYNVTKNTRGAYFVMECWFALNGGWGCNDRDTITAWTPILKPYEGSEE